MKRIQPSKICLQTRKTYVKNQQNSHQCSTSILHFEFKIKQEIYTRSFIFCKWSNKTPLNFQILYDFFSKNVWDSCKNIYHSVWLYYIQKRPIFQRKKPQFLTSKTKHTDDLLSSNSEHTISLKTEHFWTSLAFKNNHNKYFLRSKTIVPKQTEHTKAFLRLKPTIPKISYNFLSFLVFSTRDAI